MWLTLGMLRFGRLTIKELTEEIEDHVPLKGRQRILGLRAFNSTAGTCLCPEDLVENAIPAGISAIQAEVEGSEDSSQSEDEAIHWFLKKEHEAAKKRIAEEYQSRIDSGAVASASSSDFEGPPTSVGTVAQIEETLEPPEVDPAQARGPTKRSAGSWTNWCQVRGCWRFATIGKAHCCARCSDTTGGQHDPSCDEYKSAHSSTTPPYEDDEGGGGGRRFKIARGSRGGVKHRNNRANRVTLPGVPCLGRHAHTRRGLASQR